MKIYTVGGSIRDTLLGLEPSDLDYCVVGSNRAEMLAAGFSRVGSKFPVFLHPETADEYALARTEQSTGASYTDFDFETNNATIEEDLGRRDLTINSMASTSSGEIIDPFGGQADLSKQVLRHTSDAFKEDPLRVLRLARFRAILPGKWTIAHETKVICHSMRLELHLLTSERIWKELEKVMRVNALPTFFETLYELRVLDVIFPEIYEMVHCREGSKHHREANVFVHTMMMLRTRSDFNVTEQMAILFHDVAKPYTYITYGSSAGHEKAGLVEPRLPAWIPVKLRKTVLFLIVNHTRIYKTSVMKSSKIATFLAQYKSYDLLEMQLRVAQADNDGRECDEGIAKTIERSSIRTAHFCINTYSPVAFIKEYQELNSGKYPKGHVVKQHIHRENIRIVNANFERG